MNLGKFSSYQTADLISQIYFLCSEFAGLTYQFRDLYKLLDEKDEEIHIVTRLNEQLKGIDISSYSKLMCF